MICNKLNIKNLKDNSLFQNFNELFQKNNNEPCKCSVYLLSNKEYRYESHRYYFNKKTIKFIIKK